MSITSRQFWQRLADHGLASESECHTWALEILKATGKDRIDDPALIAKMLIRTNKLTLFQAKSLLQESEPTFEYGDYRLRDKASDSIFGEWLEAVHRTSGEVAWLWPINCSPTSPPKLVPEGPISQPSRELARAHAQAASPHLLPVQYLESNSLSWAVGTPARSYRPLKEVALDRPIDLKQCIDWIGKLAIGLSALHHQNLIHGHLSIDWCVVADDACPILLRDPIYPAPHPKQAQAPMLFGRTEPSWRPAAYLAPEFAWDQQQPNVQTDLYSLGCLWFTLLAGKPPFSSNDFGKLIRIHGSQSLPINDLKALPNPLARCLLHLCAKNPSARFRSVEQFLEAFDMASQSIESGQARQAPSMQETKKSKPTTQQTSPSKEIDQPKETGQPKVIGQPSQMVPAALVRSPKGGGLVSPESPPNAHESQKPIESQNSVQSQKPAEPGESLRAKDPVERQELSEPATASSPLGAVSAVRQPIAKGRSNPKKKKKKKKGKRPIWLVPTIGVVCIASCLGLVFALQRSKTETGRTAGDTLVAPDRTGQLATAQETPLVKSDPLAEQYQIVNDQESILWAPPRPSQPYSLEMIPPGANAFLFIHPQDWVDGSPEARSILKLMEVDLRPAWEGLRGASGLEVNQIKEVALAFYPGSTDWPIVVGRITLLESIAWRDLKSKWPDSVEEKLANGYSVHLSKDRAYFVSKKAMTDADTVSQFTFGTSPLIKELAELEGGSAPIRRQLETLWQSSDRQSDLTILMTPAFLRSEGKKVLPTFCPNYEDAIKNLLSSRVQGALLSTTLQPQWYFELRLMGDSDQDAGKFAQELHHWFDPMATMVEQQMVAEPAHPYWRAVAVRLPEMLRTLQQYQRYGVENGQAISNAYLPSTAAPNLTLAAWMFAKPQSRSIAVESSGAAGSSISDSTPSMNVDEKLELKIDVVFDQQSLETAMNSILEEINAAIPNGQSKLAMEIDGPAFEIGGITRNKEVRDFQFKQRPAREVLNDLVRKANPETSPALASDVQKVVWVLGGNFDGKSLIRITTRKAAKSAGIQLPREFGE